MTRLHSSKLKARQNILTAMLERGGATIFLDFGDGTSHAIGSVLDKKGRAIYQRMLCKFTCTNGGREQTHQAMKLFGRSLADMIARRVASKENSQPYNARKLGDLIDRITTKLLSKWNYFIKTTIKHNLIREIRGWNENARKNPSTPSTIKSLFRLTPPGLVDAVLLNVNAIMRDVDPTLSELRSNDFELDLTAAKDEMIEKTLPDAQKLFLDTLDEMRQQHGDQCVNVCVSGNGIASYGVEEWLKELEPWVNKKHKGQRVHLVDLEKVVDVSRGAYVAYGAAHWRVLKAQFDERSHADCGIIVTTDREVYARLTPTASYTLPFEISHKMPLTVHGVREQRAGDPRMRNANSKVMDLQIVCIRDDSSATKIGDLQPIPAGVDYSTYTVAVEVPPGADNGSSFSLTGVIQSDRTIEIRTQIDDRAQDKHIAHVISTRVGDDPEAGGPSSA